VNTSAYEGFPNVFLEAWRQGTPVVSLDIDTRRYGWREETFAGGDLDRLAEIVGRLGRDTADRKRLSTAAREQFEANFELSTVATEYGDVLERVARGRSADELPIS